MGVFWSTTDDKMVSGMANGNGYLVSIVTNHKGDFKTRFDIYPTDKSPFNYVTHMKAADDIETIILSAKNENGRSDELFNVLKKLIDDFDLEYTNTETYYDEQIASITKEKGTTLKEMEDLFDEKTSGLYDEYNEYCEGIIIDDDVLKDEIKDEVNKKVTSSYVITPNYLGYGLKYNHVTDDIDDKINNAIANKTIEKNAIIDNSKNSKLARKIAKKKRRADRLMARDNDKKQTSFSIGIDSDDELDDIYSNMFRNK
jgi:hypothetical protein